MQYRWGFIENDVFVECNPIVDDDTALDYTQESGQIFYRAKINGSLAFRFEFDAILAKGYNYTHIIVLQWYDNSDDTWKEMWRGQFALTDCEIDFDTNTISVQPTTLDRYTAILDALESEYNLVKLSAKLTPVNILIRPCTQIYLAGNTRISNYVGGNSWDAECEQATPIVLYNGNWLQLRNCAWFYLDYTSGQYAGKHAVYFMRFVMPESPFDFYDVTMPVDGRVYNSDGTYVEDTLQCRLFDNLANRWEFYITDGGGNEVMTIWYDKANDTAYGDNYWNSHEGSMIENSYFRWDRFYGRTICQSELASVTIGGNTYDLYDIENMDIAGNYNYNKFIKYVAAETYPTIETSSDPTGWPESAEGRYFVKPQNTSTRKYFPIAAESWGSVSYWFYASAMAETIETLLVTSRTIRDGYDLRNAIIRLLMKADWQGQYVISGILGGSQDYAGYRFLPVITAKSNVISSYYDTPAQNAPISLGMIFTMLKQVYKIYWYIDENNNLHLEHISYFDNGYQYTEDEPAILVDLTSKMHTRTYESKVFGQNKIKYDKQDMPQQYTFSWMDKQTMAFTGFPIYCNDQYVNKGGKEDNNIGNFDTDVDFILTAPSEVSKDGFVLFALPFYNNAYQHTLRIETISIVDENGDDYELKVQNAEGAFAKIHENMWRYALPCENVTINNLPTTAITTGRYKLQTIEFADESMADILREISNCNMAIRTQQGDGYIKTLSINLNSLAAKADLLFNFIGRWYYLRGTALGSSITISVNGESVTIDVSSNVFKYRYNTPISALTFNAADVVSVNFADCDSLDELTSTADMFKNCTELLAVDFGNKRLGAVTDAEDMFARCDQLTTLICPPTSTWKADLNFEDCPLLTTESVYSLIDYLFLYESGTHTITFNQTMWNALDPDVQTDIETKANAKGWQIGMAAAYFISGTSSASVVYATINGDAVEIDVEGGLFNYGYRSPITSIAFTGDTNVQTINFSASDGLAGVASLDNAFKDCTMLTSVDFTNCDLTNVVSASDCFANCSALTNLTIPSGTWKADVDFSTCPLLVYAEMLDIIGGLYAYTSGVHTITWNTTYWDSLTQAQQQTISDAASAKGWTTNAVAVIYTISGYTSVASETFTITFIRDGAELPELPETIAVNADGNGYFEHQYRNKKIYRLDRAFDANSTITSIAFDEEFDECVSMNYAFRQCVMTSVDMRNARFGKLKNANEAFLSAQRITQINFSSTTLAALESAPQMFNFTYALTQIDGCENFTFTNLQNAYGMFGNMRAIGSLDLSSATFGEVTNAFKMFEASSGLTAVDLSAATFAKATTIANMFYNCTYLADIDLSAATFIDTTDASYMFYHCDRLLSLTLNATFANLQNARAMFNYCALSTSISLPNATFASTTDVWGMFSSCKMTTLSIPNATFALATNAQYFLQDTKTLVTLNLPLATFASITECRNIFNNCDSLSSIDVPQNSTAILATSNPTNTPMNISKSPLTYQSMLNIANWLSDLTNYSSHTCTFNASVWNALSTAEQANIQGILQSKNWNLATA